MTERNLVTIVLIDEDKNLPVDKSLVATFENILTEDIDAVTIQQLIIDKDIAGAIKDHNEVRENTVNVSILERTGKEVMLQPVSIKNLTWKIK